MDIFSQNLAKILRERKITQAVLADGAGVSQASVNRWLKGSAVPGAKELQALASFLSLSMDELWTGKKPIYTRMDNPRDKEKSAAEKELEELKHSLRVVFRAMSEPFDQKSE